MGMERDLHDLLYTHDCVIVPHWGGFLTHYRSARLDEARKLVHPPGKDLSFNRHLVRNDGLLADHLAKREGISFDKATARIETELAEWRGSLDRSGRLELPQIGIFYRDDELNLQFDPDKRANYLKDAYGLRPLAAVPVERVRPAPVVIQMPQEQATPERAPRRTAALWIAAGFAAVLFGAAAFWVIRFNGTDSKQWAVAGLFRPRTAPSYSPPSEASITSVFVPEEFTLPDTGTGVHTLPVATNDSVFVTVDLGATPIPAVADSTAVVVRTPSIAAPAGRFHVIGGCFAQPENAEKMLNELKQKGYSARLLPQRGRLHPVAYGTFAQREEALDLLATIRQQGGGAAWLLVR